MNNFKINARYKKFDLSKILKFHAHLIFHYLVSLQSEHKVKEYRSLSNRLQMENDQLKSKLEQCHREYHFQVKFQPGQSRITGQFISHLILPS